MRAGRALLALAAWGPVLLLVPAPILGFAVFSFWLKEGSDFVPAFSLENYARLLADPTYLRVFRLTLQLALGVTALCLLLGYPLAWFIARRPPRLRGVLLALLVAPLFMSYVVKLYAVRSLLGGSGWIAQGAEALGVEIPFGALLFNQRAVFATMLLIYLPFVVLPIHQTLVRLPENLAQASADLGARPGQTFRRVVLPLSLPGAALGGIFAFVLAMGDYVTPQMVGGTRGFTYGRVVWSQFGLAYEWPFGAAMAMLLLLVSLVAIAVALRLGRRGAVTL